MKPITDTSLPRIFDGMDRGAEEHFLLFWENPPSDFLMGSRGSELPLVKNHPHRTSSTVALPAGCKAQGSRIDADRCRGKAWEASLLRRKVRARRPSLGYSGIFGCSCRYRFRRMRDASRASPRELDRGAVLGAITPRRAHPYGHFDLAPDFGRVKSAKLEKICAKFPRNCRRKF